MASKPTAPTPPRPTSSAFPPPPMPKHPREFPDYLRLDSRIDELTVRRRQIEDRLAEIGDSLTAGEDHNAAVERLLAGKTLQGELDAASRLREERSRLQEEAAIVTRAIAKGKDDLDLKLQLLKGQILAPLREWQVSLGRQILAHLAEVEKLGRLEQQMQSLVSSVGIDPAALQPVRLFGLGDLIANQAQTLRAVGGLRVDEPLPHVGG